MRLLVLGLLVSTPLLLNAQFSIDGRTVQFHGFVTQGFAYSDQNNFLTMPTSRGSFAFTDAGLNVSSQLTDKLRVGAQAYVRKIGQLGNGHVELDWALADYRFTDWFGIRAGKVKTVIGLYNDTQDAEFLHTWALLPQSLYPLDLRETTFSHVGADVYGNLRNKKFGQFAYTAYAGRTPNDLRGGYNLGLDAQGIRAERISGSTAGIDLRWTPPIAGLLVGASFANSPFSVPAVQEALNAPALLDLQKARRLVFYGQYSWGNLRLEGEYGRETQKVYGRGIFGPLLPDLTFEADHRSWYTAAAYRFSKHLELGTYNSRFFPNADRKDSGGPETNPVAARHVFDQVFTARLDFTTFWDFKIEGHLINGYGDPASFRGFYPQDNPLGFKPRTNLLVIRTGVNF